MLARRARRGLLRLQDRRLASVRKRDSLCPARSRRVPRATAPTTPSPGLILARRSRDQASFRDVGPPAASSAEAPNTSVASLVPIGNDCPGFSRRTTNKPLSVAERVTDTRTGVRSTAASSTTLEVLDVAIGTNLIVLADDTAPALGGADDALRGGGSFVASDEGEASRTG